MCVCVRVLNNITSHVSTEFMGCKTCSEQLDLSRLREDVTGGEGGAEKPHQHILWKLSLEHEPLTCSCFEYDQFLYTFYKNVKGTIYF